MKEVVNVKGGGGGVLTQVMGAVLWVVVVVVRDRYLCGGKMGMWCACSGVCVVPR